MARRKNRLSRQGAETIAKAARRRWRAYREARATKSYRRARRLLGGERRLGRAQS